MNIYHYDLVRESRPVNYDARKNITSANIIEFTHDIFEINNYNPEK